MAGLIWLWNQPGGGGGGGGIDYDPLGATGFFGGHHVARVEKRHLHKPPGRKETPLEAKRRREVV